MVTRESIFFINLRQAYFLSPLYASRISSKTVLFTSVPEEYLNDAKIRRMFGPEKVRNVWIAADTKKLEELVEERDKAAFKLEAAEVKLISLANKARVKSLKRNQNQPSDEEEANVTGAAAAADIVSSNPAEDATAESGTVAARWIKPSQRPTHRLKPVIGKKVDTINWARTEIGRLNAEIKDLQTKHRAGDSKFISSVFVEFYIQTDAQAAYQMCMFYFNS